VNADAVFTRVVFPRRPPEGLLATREWPIRSWVAWCRKMYRARDRHSNLHASARALIEYEGPDEDKGLLAVEPSVRADFAEPA
jgi:hypothetical protein